MKRLKAYDIKWSKEHAQYWQGAGVSFTPWDDVAVGVGRSKHEAFDDALEILAQMDYEIPKHLEEMLTEFVKNTECVCTDCERKEGSSDECNFCELNFYCMIYVKEDTK